MKITEELLKEQLEEMYRHYMKRARNAEDSDRQSRDMGAMEAVGAIYLLCYGGKAMTELWLEAIGNDDEGAGDNIPEE